jgi:hypothetical protein
MYMKVKLTESQINFIKEALADDIPTYMKDIIQKRYAGSDELLKKEIPKHTDLIPNTKVEVQDENITNRTISELIEYFSENIIDQFTKSTIYKMYYFDGLSPLSNLLEKSLPQTMQEDSLKSFTWMYSKEFRLPVIKDNDFKNPIFSNNKSGLATFLKMAVKAFPNELNKITDETINSIITDKNFVGLREPIVNYQTNIKKIKDSKLYLYITDRPDDKLRMSISLFYDSCQNIYSGGEQGTQYNKKLLSNVFDENSKVAYLIFNTPFKDKMGNDHPFTSIARTVLRVNNEGGVMFDKVYPGDMEGLFYKIIKEKTGLKNTGESGDVYHYKGIAGLPSPYMDKYSLKNTGERESSMDFDYVRLLTYVTGIDTKDIIPITDNTYQVGNQEWAIYPHEQAIERTRDFFRDSFFEYYYKTDVIKIIGANILSVTDIAEELNIDLDELEDEYGREMTGINDFSNFLKNEMDINNIGDLFNSIENITSNRERVYRWFENTIDLDNVIRYIGGETEAMSHALAPYDGEVHDESGYIIVRTD